MAPIIEQTPQVRPQATAHHHTRTSSLFSSFRSKPSAPSDPPAGAQRGGPTGMHSAPQPTSHAQAPPPQSSSPTQQQPVQPEELAQPQPSQGPPQPQQRAGQPPQTPPAGSGPPAPIPLAQLHPEIRSVVQLTAAHAHKIYFSGPLIRRIERQTDGHPPSKDEGWVEVWAQLGGTTLSVWDMKAIQEASRQGREVPPTYVNVTDAFVQVLGSVTIPATETTPAQRYTNVLTLNTAGSNLLLFACPSPAALISWAAALRLSAWEKSRLEEIYTAHLIRITLNAPATPTTLIRGKMEGWVRIRIAGQTDWKRVWMSVCAGNDNAVRMDSNTSHASLTGGAPAPAQSMPKKRRISSYFSREPEPGPPGGPAKPEIIMYNGPKPKDKKKPVLTMKSVTQTFAVYPERPELISRSTLIKVEGFFGDEETAGALKLKEGWLLLMPDLDGGLGQSAEMLKWIIALHDAFELYGRPDSWTWDPRDPASLMFGYPVGPHKDLLFLDRELAETHDPRDERTSSIRSRLLNILLERMRAGAVGPLTASPTTPDPDNQPAPATGNTTNGPQLPPLSFGNTTTPNPPDKPLTPITERSSIHTNIRGGSGDALQSPRGSIAQNGPPPVLEEPPTVLNRLVSSSPTPADSDFARPQQSSQVLNQQPTRSPQPTSPTLQPIRLVQPVETQTPPAALPVRNPARTSSGSNSQLGVNASGSPTQTTHSPTLQSPLSPVGPLKNPYSAEPSPTHTASSPAVSRGNTYALDTAPSSSFGASTQAVQPSTPPSGLQGQPPRRPPSDDPHALLNEPGALYYMQFEGLGPIQPRSGPPPENQEDSTSGSDSSSPRPDHPSTVIGTAKLGNGQNGTFVSTSPGLKQGSPMGYSIPGTNVMPTPATSDYQHHSTPAPAASPSINSIGSSSSVDRLNPVRPGLNPLGQGLGRKPSGARAPPTRTLTIDGSSYAPHPQHPPIPDESAMENALQQQHQQNSRSPSPSNLPYTATEDANLDALAALTYLDVNDPEEASSHVERGEPQIAAPQPQASANLSMPPPPPIPGESPVGQVQSLQQQQQYKSSFAPSKQAAERKAKAQAQQAAHHAAVHKPGRTGGRRKNKAAGGAWESSDEEEEEEDDEDDDEADSDTPAPAVRPPGHLPTPPPNASAGSSRFASPNLQAVDGPGYSHPRPPRTLPQPPGARPHGEFEDHRRPSEQDGPRRTYYDEGPQFRTQAEVPQPGAARQNVWSQALESGGRSSGHLPGESQSMSSGGRDTFVQLESSEAMTKAFTPHGLLSAGIQDKQDRSAKRQEELARETGASLINVPNKPPPPQTGLLGAITAHERDRKREGGVGAALTEREREKRLAEERQRRFDDHQRQQLDQMQQTGSMYGAPFGYPMMNPMMMNPMMNPMMTGPGMVGMNPMMMGGGGGGMNPMMTGMMSMNPHLIAQQAAAQAYQQAMMTALSVAGSQVGGGDAGNAAGGANQAAMAGGANGMGMGFDPRMSMMSMSMMGMPQMSPQMSPMGQQMTGMSMFDPRLGPGGMGDGMGMGGGGGGGVPGGLQPPGPVGGPYSTGNNSPRRGSPLAQSAEAGRNISPRPISPKP
ncbi:hypothetical protein BDN72DRAFT_877898 [Pluteus cervinus]|uniref:Uncharacterized protein n=1 Tax=Pluteus cervinus TaxID=181527 RepID=A0ACD3AXS4_9AGAR|nr:hypothetical protein BDN72DRAFT_877898 [Pluteus cervinus]